jgi:putative glutamine amidotransferase
MARQTRPLVGINTDFVPAGKTGGAQLKLHSGYCESVYEAGGLPILIPPVLKEADLDDLLDRLDGLVLVGSPYDMDPKRMGLNPHPAVQPMPARREEADRMICRMAIDRQMPLLAVAVGMHELNVLCGGSLFLHLPEDLPKALPHRDGSGGPHRHTVLLEPNTRLDLVYGGGEIRVNSYHHQAVQNVAKGFRVSAKSPDGVIEAIEAEDEDWFCVGVQWHPHSETASALDKQLFEAFVRACGLKEAALKVAA